MALGPEATSLQLTRTFVFCLLTTPTSGLLDHRSLFALLIPFSYFLVLACRVDTQQIFLFSGFMNDTKKSVIFFF